MHAIQSPRGEREHRARMVEQSIAIPGPWPFLVTFSIETGHPVGSCRHMSMSVERVARVPSLEAVWIVAEILGFQGSIEACAVWPEQLRDGGTAVNLVQPQSLH